MVKYQKNCPNGYYNSVKMKGSNIMLSVKHGPQTIHTIDTHTGGDPTRIVVSGLPDIPGETMLDKKQYIIDNLDHIRRSVLLEPRGHKDMFGALLLDPIHPDADVGVIYLSNQGYLNMCGHGTIGVTTALIESGIIAFDSKDPVVLETPAGLVYVDATLEGNKVTNVSIQNVPAFLWEKDVKLDIPELGNIKVDVAFGGSFFVLVDSEKSGIKDLSPANNEYLAELGVKIIEEANKIVKVEHPEEKKINKIELILFLENSNNDNINTRNVNVFGEGQVARSACGTGLSAQMAVQSAKGLLDKESQYNTESIINTPFFGRIVDETTVGKRKAIIPEINGDAFITGKHEFILHPEDELKNGFLLK